MGVGGALGANVAGAAGGGGGVFAASEDDDPLKMIEKLHGLYTKGIISKDEFETKKNELMKKVR
jgi:hypothetical protein